MQREALSDFLGSQASFVSTSGFHSYQDLDWMDEDPQDSQHSQPRLSNISDESQSHYNQGIETTSVVVESVGYSRYSTNGP